MSNPLIDVQQYGQSIWFDNIRRGLILSGELQAMVNQDGLLGVTSNPAIFEKALVGSTDYDQATKALVAQGVGDAKDVYERLAIEDIQLAADVLHPAYIRTAGRDGYVSFEVSPYLAHDTAGTIAEGRRLWKAIARDNVMIKVPATPEGLPAITQLLSDGINVNITLLFAVEMYAKVAQAYLTAMEQLAARGADLAQVNSVASFFVSRIDSLVDDKLNRALDASRDAERRTKLKSLLGKVAIANAKIAYAHYLELIQSPRWKALAEKGARTQRLLWASTSTKNPKYAKTLYVDELIGADTVNTIPADTFVEFRKSGRARPALTENWESNLAQARDTMRTLAAVGISMDEVTAELLRDGVAKFAEPMDKLLAAIEKKRQVLLGRGLDRQMYALDDMAGVNTQLDDWRVNGKVRRLWDGDASLWTNADEAKWLGWLHVVEAQRENAGQFAQLAEEARSGEFDHVMVLGMGGSSLCPEVLRHTFGHARGYPELLVLDSTVPAQVKAFEQRIDVRRTVFVVSSKSGSTIEPNVFKQYFFDKVQQALGADQAGSRFIAVTDPGTAMYKIAKQDRFRHIALGLPSIGGRYSALSNFGMVPAALAGVDVPAFLDRTEVMVHSCASCVPPEMNPGVLLGAVMGTCALDGRDKVTIVASPAIGSLGSWLEQLIAESTGKLGKGLIPIAEEDLGAPAAYGNDRLFVYVRLASAPSATQDAAIEALGSAGHPVVRIGVDDIMELGQEFFRWEIATAVAGSILGINAFDQPDVEAAKIAARKLTAAYEQSGTLPAESPILREDGIQLFTDGENAKALQAAGGKTLESYLAAHLRRLRAGDYFAITAYVEMNDAHRAALQSVRHAVRDAKRVATTLGFGPRFLHSTGQLHKGGPNAGVFLQVTSDDAADLPIPGQRFTFGVLKRAQAQGDFEVLATRGRRILRVHLGADVGAGLQRMRELVQRAVA